MASVDFGLLLRLFLGLLGSFFLRLLFGFCCFFGLAFLFLISVAIGSGHWVGGSCGLLLSFGGLKLILDLFLGGIRFLSEKLIFDNLVIHRRILLGSKDLVVEATFHLHIILN